jgi:two-component system sensor histidine kinase UhpB
MTLAGPLGRLLRVRLFTKILVANAVLVTLSALAGALAGAELAAGSERQAIAVAVPIVLAALVLTVLVDAAILQLALDPLHRLERAALRVREGDMSVRAPRSELADPDLARLGEAFNDALERVALYRQKLGELAARSVRREEADRDRVVRALHEDTAQRLAALLVRLRIAAGESQKTGQLEWLLEESRQEIATALDLIRAFASDRRPRVLDELGLVAAVEAHARELGERGLEVEVEAHGRLSRREPEFERDLYWIVREALDNVVAHAGARRAVVRIACSEDGTSLEVEDDGRGFDVQAEGAGALGLFEIRERAAAAGGALQVDSRPGAGTRVRATFDREHATRSE